MISGLLVDSGLFLRLADLEDAVEQHFMKEELSFRLFNCQIPR